MLYWDTGQHTWNFFSERYTFFNHCYDSVDQPKTIQSRGEHIWHASAGEIPVFDYADDLPLQYATGAWMESIPKNSQIMNSQTNVPNLAKRVQQLDGSVPPIPGGCTCAAINVRTMSYEAFMAPNMHIGRN